MYCPVCRSEFRKGIEECATCGVALVAQLPRSPARAPVAERIPSDDDPVDVLVEHCGFLTLEDARQARDTLRNEGIPSEILIRDADGENGPATPEEEYWLRVPARRRTAVEQLLGEFEEVVSAPSAAEEATVACSDCGKPVAEEETECPHCGAQFE